MSRTALLNIAIRYKFYTEKKKKLLKIKTNLNKECLTSAWPGPSRNGLGCPRFSGQGWKCNEGGGPQSAHRLSEVPRGCWWEWRSNPRGPEEQSKEHCTSTSPDWETFPPQTQVLMQTLPHIIMHIYSCLERRHCNMNTSTRQDLIWSLPPHTSGCVIHVYKHVCRCYKHMFRSFRMHILITMPAHGQMQLDPQIEAGFFRDWACPSLNWDRKSSLCIKNQLEPEFWRRWS